MEMVMTNGFTELSANELEVIEGGRNWVATIAGTVAGVVGGVCLLITPEPTTLTKVGGWAAVTGGVSSVVWAWS